MPGARVLHVITRLDWGGSAENTVLTAIGQASAGRRVTVAFGSTAGASEHGGPDAVAANVRRLSAAGVATVEIPMLVRSVHPFLDLAALSSLVRLIRRERPDIVHTHTSKAGIVGRLAARFAHAPAVVHTPHGHVYYGHFGRVRSDLFLLLERLFARWTDRFIALTEAERDEHVARRVGQAGRFAVVPSGIDLARYRQARALPKRPERFDCPSDAVIVGSVGWLTFVKGHHILIEALARLRAAHPAVHVVLVGTGDRRGALQALAERHAVAERVHFLGHRHDIPDCLASMDVFVLPSLNEGMGRALVEAMAAGRPVIASRVGGIPAVITHQKTGLLVPVGDAPALAAAIASLLASPHRMKDLAAAGADTIDERFGIDGMVRRIDDVYREAMPRHDV
jgi:glycosyltransferase involved in cell wall biosynthesis